MAKLHSKEVITVLDTLSKRHPTLPLKEFTRKRPFVTLITTILSQRARDDTTLPLAEKLFKEVGDTPMAFLRLGKRKLEQLIIKAGFYRQKARHILDMCTILVNEFKGRVPRKLDALLRLPGVGRKTANIVLEHCFDIPAIAVDVHVHRITNRLGWIRTKTPEETEERLMKIIPQRKWRVVNRVFVRHGQTLCGASKPKCEVCPVKKSCAYGRRKTLE